MKHNANGINPIVAILLTALAAVLTIVSFAGGHGFWGVVFALITADFAADARLAFRPHTKGDIAYEILE